ncbi:MAG: DUF4136 domain-containing protein [Verrucomicrobia bacterium]|nr:DUF4136 domain-containing protein [Verrucomicrobiota bacterium]
MFELPFAQMMKTKSILLIFAMVVLAGCHSRYYGQIEIERRVFHTIELKDIQGKAFCLAPIDPTIKGSQEYQTEAKNLIPLLTAKGMKFLDNGQSASADYTVTFEFALSSTKNTEARPHETYGTVSTYPTLIHAAGESTGYSHMHNASQLTLRIYKNVIGSQRGMLVYEGGVSGFYVDDIDQDRLITFLVQALLEDFPSQSGERIKKTMDIKDIKESQ